MCNANIKFFFFLFNYTRHDYDVKMPKFVSSRGREYKTTTFFFLSQIKEILQEATEFYRDFTIPGLYHFTVYGDEITKDNLYKCKIYKDSIDFFGKSINFSVFLLYSAGKITDFS